MIEIKFVHYETSGKLDNPPALYEAGRDLTKMVKEETEDGGKLESVFLASTEYDQEHHHTSMVLMLMYRKPAS